MSNKRTVKALEELVKTEYMAVAALDSALEETEDNKLRKQYRKWRDSHMKQADALNDRLEDLGGEPLEYEVGTGKGQATLWGKLAGMRDDTGVAGMRIGAERGIKRYIDHLDDIDDPKTLNMDPEKAEKAIGKVVSLDKEQEFKSLFPDCAIGAMPPFGNLYGLSTYVEKHLAEQDYIVFEAGTHTDAIKMSYRDYDTIVKPKVEEVAIKLQPMKGA